RPRKVSPLPDSFWRVGENDGDSDEIASTSEPLIETCSARVLESTTSTVIGRALAGRLVRAAVITTSETSAVSACAAPARLKASRLAPAAHKVRRPARPFHSIAMLGPPTDT